MGLPVSSYTSAQLQQQSSGQLASNQAPGPARPVVQMHVMDEVTAQEFAQAMQQQQP